MSAALGMSERFSGVWTAIIPQPISTPTAAGITAPFVGSTVPTSPSAVVTIRHDGDVPKDERHLGGVEDLVLCFGLYGVPGRNTTALSLTRCMVIRQLLQPGIHS